MSIYLTSGLTPTFAWLAVRPSKDVDFLLGYIDDVVTTEDKNLLLSLLKPLAFSEKRSRDELERSVCAIKELRRKKTIDATGDGL